MTFPMASAVKDMEEGSIVVCSVVNRAANERKVVCRARADSSRISRAGVNRTWRGP